MAEKKSLEFNSNYTYNPDTDTYVIPVKHRVKSLVLKGYKIRSIRKSISNFLSPSETAADICLKYKISVEDFDSIKKSFNLSRDAFPLTDEEVLADTVEQGVDKLLEEKRTLLAQTFEKTEWKNTQENSQKWLEYQNNILDPLESVLENWKPKPIILKLFKVEKTDDKVLVVSLSDQHFGAAANARYMFNRPNWTTQDTVNAIEKYATEIIKKIKERNYNFKKIILLAVGDHIHSQGGKTTRGTELKYDKVREEQFEAALESFNTFIQRLYEVIPNIDVISTYGNHFYELDMALFRALEKSFKNNKTIKFTHFSSRPGAFREGSTLFLVEHGGDSVERAYAPINSDSKIQSHVQSLLLTDPKMLIGVKTKIFAMGHVHHHQHIDYGTFELFIFGTTLGGCEHANTNNLMGRARQSCLVLDESGLSEVIHIFFD